MSWVDKVTTGKWSFVSITVNVAPSFAAAVKTITQFADQVRIRLISQVIKRILRILQKLLKYFNGKTFSAFFVALPSVWLVILSLKWSESETLATLKTTITKCLFTASLSAVLT